MSVVNRLLRTYAYLYHLTLSGVLLGLAILAATQRDELWLNMLPFRHERLISRVSMMSLAGFICVFLAVVRIFEIVLPAWTLALLAVFVWGFFFTTYSFSGPIGLGGALTLIAATMVAVYASFVATAPPRRERW